jgi:Asp/Glu/hydantoin racemase
MAGDRAIGIGVTGLNADGATDAVEERMREVGRQLIEEDGADVLIMGCAGMARYRHSLEDTLGVPVIDPSQAAVANAIAAVRLGYSNSTMKA